MGQKNEKIEELTFDDPKMQQGYFRNSEKLKEITMLEERRKWCFFLFPTQLNKIERKAEFEGYLEEIKAGTWVPPEKKMEPTVDLNDTVLYETVDDDEDNVLE